MVKKLLHFLVIVLTIAGAGTLYFADRIPDPESRDKVISIREQVLGTSESATNGIKQTLLNQLTSKTSEATKSYGIVVGDQEIYFETVLQDLTTDIQNLPQEQYKILQQKMCADLVEQAKKEACSIND